MDASAHDLLLVGGGAVGVRATITAVELNAKHSIVIVSNVYPMRSTLFPRKAAQPVSSTRHRPALHTTTVSGGDWHCDQQEAEAFVKEAPL